MLSLLFPNPDALRLALASGIIPGAVACCAVAAAPGDAGGMWIQTQSSLDKLALAALAHIGVRPVTRPTEVKACSFPCWAAALPLKRVEADPPDGPTLFELPAIRLAKFLAELARCGCAVEGYRFVESTAFVRVAVAPEYWIARIGAGDDPEMRCYWQTAPNFWVQAGWQHSLPTANDAEVAPTVLVAAPQSWRVLPLGDWHTPREVIALRRGGPSVWSPAAIRPVEVTIRLKRIPEPAGESFWIVPGNLASLRPFLESADHRTFSNLSLAQLLCPDAGECIALRSKGESVSGAPIGGAFRAFAPHPALPRLMLPVGLQPAPPLRPAALASALGAQPADVLWLEPHAEGMRRYRMPIGSFRPLAEAIRYTAPEGHRHRKAPETEKPFVLCGFTVIPETVLIPPPALLSGVRHSRSVTPSQSGSARSRIAKWAGKLFAKSKIPGSPGADSDAGEPDFDIESDPPERIALTRRERIARRVELEDGLFDRAIEGRVAERWAELAELYTEGGNPTDAALCWMHAVWNSPHPSDAWIQRWAKVEARMVNSSGDSPPIRRELIGWIRLANHPTSQHVSPAPADLQACRARLESTQECLPCRLAWLARVALSRLGGGDVLLLARGRDGLFARLQHEAALAALDTPSFLRFRGLAGSDRYPLARDWLLRCREPIHRWLKKQAKGTRLSWAGLDADIPSTQAYADLMLAWGFAKLGDRIRTTELAACADQTLQNAAAQGPDPQVHARLVGLFHREIDAAIRTRAADGDAERIVEPAMLADYAVAKLVAHSMILNRAAGRSEFGAGPLAALLGQDDLGSKLLVLLERRIPADERNVRPLLDLASADRTAATLPRIILALLEVAESREVIADLLPLGPQALELLPEALRLRGIDGAESSNYLVRLSGCFIEGLCRAAIATGDRATLQSLTKTLLRGLDAGDTPTRDMLRTAAPRLFRALSRSGLTAEIRSLLSRWYAAGGDRTEANLGAAIGWYTLGETERGNRILNDARERLFVAGIADERERTRTALAYAQALAHAPPRLALGRLEELFQRLGTITTEGATARYYALKPLELIDTAITAIVNEDFSLGPEVRSWLDEDERRLRGRITRDLDAALKGMETSYQG